MTATTPNAAPMQQSAPQKIFAVLAVAYVVFHFVNLFVVFGPLGSKILHIGLGIGVLSLDVLRRRPTAATKLLVTVAWATAAAAAAHFYLDQIGVLTRYGFSSSADVVAGAVLVFWMFIFTGLYFGAPFAIVGIFFFVYAYLGSYLPAPLTAPTTDLLRVTSKLTVGSLGDVVELSVTVIFLLLVFGTLLQASGAGAFIWRFAADLAKRIGGGTGALTVASSGLVASFTGVGAANVGITGPIAIPLMKRDGYTAEQAAAIEAIASTGGQITPPVLGMVAFLMADFIGVPYANIALAAILPAALFYFGLLLFVVLVYRRNGGRGEIQTDLIETQLSGGMWKIVVSFVVPIAVIVTLIVEGMSVQMAVFWAVVSIAIIGLVLRLQRDPKVWLAALIEASVNGAALGMASGVLDVVMASLDVTQLGMIVGFIVSQIGGTSVLANFLLVLVAAYVLGMGMPGVAVYMVLALTLAPVLIGLGAEPLVAHFLIMYMTILSNFTPPVAPTLMLTARIAGANYIRSGIEAIKAGAGSMFLPFFLFAYPALLMVGASAEAVIEAVAVTVVCIFLLTVSLLGWFGRRISGTERIVAGVLPALIWSFKFIDSPWYWLAVIGGVASAGGLVFVACRASRRKVAKVAPELGRA